MSTTRFLRRRAPATPTVRRLGTGEPTGAVREPLAPVWASATRRANGHPRWLPRVTRGRALAMLVVSLVVLMGGTLAVSAAAAAPGNGGGAAQPAPTPPVPLPTVEPCPPDSSLPTCHLPAPSTSPPTTGVSLPIPTAPPSPVTCFPGSLQYECLNPSTTAPPVTPPCTGEGCIPQPATSAPAPTNPGTGQSGDSGNGDADCDWSPGSWDGCVTNAINAFFRGVVTDALNPLLDLLSKSLLTTPTPDSLPRIGELWSNSWQILLASYAMLILIAGVLVMGYETLQTRHSVKEVAPRIVVGFLAGALSLWVATKGIEIANGLAQAVMGGGLDASSAGETLKNLVLGSLNGGIFIIFVGIFLAGMLVVLLITYIVRVALTVILIAGAPIALMFHALPQTEGIARWWWKAFGGCLAIQVVQSLTLITAMKVFLAPGGFTLFGPTADGLVNLLVALALMYILFKIPFWVLGSLRGGGGRSLLSSVVRGFIAYKALGLLGGRSGGGGGGPGPSGGGGGGHGGGGRGPTGPYPPTRTTAGGQDVLPLRHTRSGRKSRPAPAPKPPTVQGRQLALPLGDDWPENKPVLGRDGQYRLPLNVERITPPTSPASPERQGSGGRRRGGQQLALPFDPYQGNRPTRSGQYPLPLDGPRRVTTTKPAPATSPARPAPRAGRQLRLPLDLPKPPRRTPPPLRPNPGGKP